MPAKSLHSYANTLYDILAEFNPETVFEWGPGVSTQIFALYPSVEKVISVEHDDYFFQLVDKFNFENVKLEYKPNMEDYSNAIGEDHYDLIFVDGRDRSNCLKYAKKLSDLVVLHDAARLDYRDAVDDFKYQIWTDEGNTVVLTNSEDIYERAKNKLRMDICKKPNPEVIKFKDSAKEKGWTV